jgi:hypothetical protein
MTIRAKKIVRVTMASTLQRLADDGKPLLTTLKGNVAHTQERAEP